MFNPTLIVIEAFIRELRAMYSRTYTNLEPNYPGILSFAAQLALETIATSDAVYHDVNHTVMVTLVGQEISANLCKTSNASAPRPRRGRDGSWTHTF
jgi:hypothetical protein